MYSYSLRQLIPNITAIVSYQNLSSFLHAEAVCCDNDSLDCAFIPNVSSELSELCLVESVRLNVNSLISIMKHNATFAGNINCYAQH